MEDIQFCKTNNDKMAQHVVAFASNPEYLSSALRTHIVEGDK